MSNREARKKNPLYVVTNQGKDVQEASGLFDMIVKKLGLEGVVELLDGLISSMLEMVTSYAMFVTIKSFLDHFIHQVELILAKLGLGPVVPLNTEA